MADTTWTQVAGMDPSNTTDVQGQAAASAAAAAVSAAAAAAAKTAAEAAQAAAETAFDNFDDIYLGAKASEPTLDNDGDPLTAGDIYFNTGNNTTYIYSGSAWVAIADGIASVSADTTPSLGGNLDAATYNITNVTNLQFAGGTGSQGTVSWNADDETLDLIQDGATLQLGQEVQWHCRNNTGVQINNGTVVMATGTIGASSRITIAPMDGTNPANAHLLLGIATEDIANGTDGKITHFGKVRGVDTSSFSEGQILYVSTTVAGGLTATEPTTGLNLPIAFVVSSHASTGTLAVRVTTHDENIALEASDIGVTVQGYDVDTTKNDVANTFTAAQTFNNTVTHNGTVNYTGEIQLNGSAGTSGQVLTSQGAGVDPIWAAASGGIGEFIDTSIAISSDNSALANDDGTTNHNIGLGGSALAAVTSGTGNIGLGYQTGQSNVTSALNTFIGYQTAPSVTGGNNTIIGAQAAFSATMTGGYNVGVGVGSLNATTSGTYNSALGSSSLRGVTTGSHNLGVGQNSGFYLTTGLDNLALGRDALRGNATFKLTGSYNTGICRASGYSLTTGGYNFLGGFGAGYNLTTATSTVYLGRQAGENVTIGGYNIGIGEFAGRGSTSSSGTYNTAVGTESLYSVSSGSNNTTIGYKAAYYLTSGGGNVAVGESALQGDSISKLTGSNNIGIGRLAGASLTTGTDNILIGQNAGDGITTTNDNIAIGRESLSAAHTRTGTIAIGYQALNACTTGLNNVAIGYQAMKSGNVSSSVAIGYQALSNASLTGSNNIAIGDSSGAAVTSGAFNVLIGHQAGESLNTSSQSVLIGYLAGQNVTSPNTLAIGGNAGKNITSGLQNLCIGQNAGAAITTGDQNTIIGYTAGDAGNTSDNTIIGNAAGTVVTGNQNTFIGSLAANAATSGANNTVIGYNAQKSSVTASNEITIGSSSANSFRLPGLNIDWTDAPQESEYNLTGTDINPANGTLQYKTLTANTTFTESLSNGHYVTLMIDDGAAYTITWPTITWVNNAGAAPTLATTGYTVIAIWQMNNVLYGALVGDGT